MNKYIVVSKVFLGILILMGCVSNSAYAQLTTGQINTQYTGLYFGTSASSSISIIGDQIASKFLFKTSNTDRVVIDPDGRVGIGIGNSSPTAMLHIAAPSGSPASALASFESGQGITNLTAKLISSSFFINGNALTALNGYTRTVSTDAHNAGSILLQNNNLGNVGIGYYNTNAGSFNVPNSKLHIQGGNLQITNSDPPPALANTNKYGLTMGFNGGTTKAATDYSWIQSSNGPIVLNPNSTTSLTTQTNSYVAIGFNPTTADGISTALGYNLVVRGKVLCEELKIKLKPTSGPWPDYVFASNYKLMTVDSLQSYINTNCHLPDVPSTEEVEENGIMAGEMNAILLKKVEELTLYMIDQNKKNVEQTTSIINQNEQIKLLKEQNELLMQQVKLLMQK